MKKIITLLCLISVVCVQAQVQYGGTPPSFNAATLSEDIPIEKMPLVDMDVLKKQDAIFDQQKDIPWRFGKKMPVSLNVESNGLWEELPNGDRIWRLKIESADAQTINFIFNQFKLPVGTELYLYNEDRTDVRGAFNYKNNLPHGGLGTDFLVGDLITLELFEPKANIGKTKLQISHVVHGYRSLNYLNNLEKTGDIGTSGSCNINVICPIANNWRDEIRSVGLMIRNGNAFCTGSLINNTCEDATPYFLTADHCIGNPNQVANYVIRFNFESTTCNNNSGPYITNQSISGTTLRASNSASDFCLLELSSAPPLEYNVYYAGWDRNTSPPQNSVGIHHPRGDLKKFSVDEDPATTSTFSGASTWRVGNWEAGTTEGGSSGSPLFNQNKKIVGQLYGGSASCSSNTEDQYGKFDVSWNNGNNTNARLREWLDPCLTNTMTLNGADFNVPTLDNDAEIIIVSPTNVNECTDNANQIIRIRNNGANALTEVTFSYGLDGNFQTHTWTGSLEFAQSEDVIFDDLVFCSGVYTYSAFITSSSLAFDENPNNDEVSSTFEIINGKPVTIEIQTNFAGNENSYEIVDENNNVLFSEDNFGNNNNRIFNYCLPGGNYRFIIYDTGNNGMTPTFIFDEGYYRLFVDGVLIGEGSDFGGQDQVNFNISGQAIDVNFSVPDNLYPGELLTFESIGDNNPNINYSWSAPEGVPSTETGSIFITSFQNTGSFEVSLTGETADACVKKTRKLGIWPVSINEVGGVSLKIFPNPTSNEVNILHDSSESLNLRIFNSIGKLVLQKDANF